LIDISDLPYDNVRTLTNPAVIPSTLSYVWSLLSYTWVKWECQVKWPNNNYTVKCKCWCISTQVSRWWECYVTNWLQLRFLGIVCVCSPCVSSMSARCHFSSPEIFCHIVMIFGTEDLEFGLYQSAGTFTALKTYLCLDTILWRQAYIWHRGKVSCFMHS
jgi:hypothetical protein